MDVHSEAHNSRTPDVLSVSDIKFLSRLNIPHSGINSNYLLANSVFFSSSFLC